MKIVDKNFEELISAECISVLGGLLAGTVLVLYTQKLLLLPGMFILLPGFLEMRGNISGSFAARLSSGLFLGIIKPNKINTKLIGQNLLASFTLATAVSLMLGLVAFVFNYLIAGVIFWKIILIPLLAGIIANAIEIPLTLGITVYLFRKGHDPNNIMGPVITTTGDITSIIALLIAIVIL